MNIPLSKKEDHHKSDTIWSPLQYSIFRMLWITSIISNIGSWMNDVTIAWFMTTLTDSPLWVSLVQSVTAFSIFLLALPAGALADILDKRFYLIILQTFMMIAAGILTSVSFLGSISPELLLFLTFCLGAGAALSTPTWFALMSELVPPKELPSAVTLSGLTINVARAIGPTLGGIIIAAIGFTAVFALNALSFLGIIISLFGWQRSPQESILPTERLFGAMRAGIRYVRNSPALQVIFIKSSAFFIFSSSVWALLPLIAKVNLSSGALGYGALYGSLGIGAVFGAFLIQKARKYLYSDRLVLLGSLGFAITILTLSLSDNLFIASSAMILGGISWTFVVATFMTLVQQVASSWVRARALSIFLAIFFGVMAFGSILWGLIASHLTISLTLFICALGLIMTTLLTYFLTSVERFITDFTPLAPLLVPYVEEKPHYDQGPVMVTVEVIIDPKHLDDFSHVMKDVRRMRLRDGAFFWALYKDIEESNKFIECFMVDSWVEHLRQHERMSVLDREIQNKASAFHMGKNPPRVTHFVAHDIFKGHRHFTKSSHSKEN